MLPIIDPEFKALIPSLSNEEREQLEHNITSGKECREAIILWNGVIIDGHNRFEICTKHSIMFGIREISFESRDDAKLWILSEQLGKRNLCDAARIEIALKKAEIIREKAKQNQKLKGSSKTSTQQTEPIDVRKVLAAEAGVSTGTFTNYMQIKKDGNPELIAKVQKGEMKIGTAHKHLGKEILKELTLSSGMYKFIFENLPTPCGNTNHVIYNRLNNLRHLLEEVLYKMKGD